MDWFPSLHGGGFEALHFFSDRASGLRALVAIHSTVLGLARGMTYKAALAGLEHGGGKAVIMLLTGAFDRPRLLRAFGRAVNSLAGRYITTEDSGTSPEDMEHIGK